MHRLYAINFNSESISEKPLKYWQFDFKIVSQKYYIQTELLS